MNFKSLNQSSLLRNCLLLSLGTLFVNNCYSSSEKIYSKPTDEEHKVDNIGTTLEKYNNTDSNMNVATGIVTQLKISNNPTDIDNERENNNARRQNVEQDDSNATDSLNMNSTFSKNGNKSFVRKRDMEEKEEEEEEDNNNSLSMSNIVGQNNINHSQNLSLKIEEKNIYNELEKACISGVKTCAFEWVRRYKKK